MNPYTAFKLALLGLVVSVILAGMAWVIVEYWPLFVVAGGFIAICAILSWFVRWIDGKEKAWDILNPKPRDPVELDEDGTWWFYDETWGERYGPFESESVARTKLSEYCDAMGLGIRV